MNNRVMICVAATIMILLVCFGVKTGNAIGPQTFEFGPGTVTTTDATTGWGGYNSVTYPVFFDGSAGPITVKIYGLDLSAINYTGDMGWPPTSDDMGAFAGFGVTDSVNYLRYQVLSNMGGGKGIWDCQGAGRYFNAPPHPNPCVTGDQNGYRSYLFQGWSSIEGNKGNHQTNAEQWGNGSHPEYDTLDMWFNYSGGITKTVTAWIRMHASWAWDDNNRTANWGWPWNPAVNNAAFGTADLVWDGTSIDEVPSETARVNGAWVRVYDGPWTTTADLSAVQPFVFIQNWQYANGPYTVTWSNLVVTGVPVFDSVGDCISTLIDYYCSGLKGSQRAECNHDQQSICHDLFEVPSAHSRDGK